MTQTLKIQNIVFVFLKISIMTYIKEKTPINLNNSIISLFYSNKYRLCKVQEKDVLFMLDHMLDVRDKYHNGYYYFYIKIPTEYVFYL